MLVLFFSVATIIHSHAIDDVMTALPSYADDYYHGSTNFRFATQDSAKDSNKVGGTCACADDRLPVEYVVGLACLEVSRLDPQLVEGLTY